MWWIAEGCKGFKYKGGNSFTRNEIDELTKLAITMVPGYGLDCHRTKRKSRTLLTKFLSKDEVNEIIKTMKAEPGDMIIFCADKLRLYTKLLET